ncbi:aromatic acid exporter family protein [Streptomyces sp. NPDC058221]|uniref:FUSC family protein n=1 Tax=Streptomyces sp. NPDC058221 TaxID=3346388 RepID=UPI0036DFACC4
MSRSVQHTFTEPGYERQKLVQSLKAAGAAVIAWAVTGWWLQAPMALLAPWTAIALVTSTVYQSLRTGTQQLMVIVVGTLWASAAMALTDDNTVIAMILTLPAMMLIGNYRHLGIQGIYGATTALFVITDDSGAAPEVGHRLLETLIGAAVGITANALVLAPTHLQNVRARLRRLAEDSSALLNTMADGLRNDSGLSHARTWHERASCLNLSLDDLSNARRWASEGSRFNPGRRLRRSGAQPPHPDADIMWDRVCTRILALTRTLSDEQELPPASAPFLAQLSLVLERASHVCGAEGELLRPSAEAEAVRADRASELDEAFALLDALADPFRHERQPATALAGVLLLETRQLMLVLAADAAEPR